MKSLSKTVRVVVLLLHCINGFLLRTQNFAHPTGFRFTTLNGVPKLFRWLADSHPLAIDPLPNELSKESRGVDNFFLDMNGIVHSCTHNNDHNIQRATELEMFQSIKDYTNSLVELINPRQTLFIALDGVAPKAKMNQQRSRRYRTAKENSIESSFDSNSITPGTQFMHNLGHSLREWIEDQVSSNPIWQKCAKVVFSGSDVPGEGEHKIMDFIRNLQRERTGCTEVKGKHCIYGLDGDLIMLGLVTHEPNVILLREKATTRKRNKQLRCTAEDFEIARISVIRQALSDQFYPTRCALPLNGGPDFIERIVDDFVFICFLVGNDFFPGLLQLDIADGAISSMLILYEKLLPIMGGFLTDKTRIHFPRFELFMRELARWELLVFRQKAEEQTDYAPFDHDLFKTEFYKVKFGTISEASPPTIVSHYIEGLIWALNYYHRECISWSWYYPHWYGPLASDFINLARVKPTFRTGKRMTPLLQLLSVLPPQSSNLLPKAYANLIGNSSLMKYFPKDFLIDMSGKVSLWEGVPKIPFLPTMLVLQTAATIEHSTSLSAEERARNIEGEVSCFDSHLPITP